ncbi:MAG: DUF4321 domain-containing protein [Actinobacteria bacterium]|nr:DUF4321 domain-containing protein [Actinomycetota bacterium]
MERPVRRTRHPRRSYPAIAVALFLGAMLGGILGELLSKALPFLARNYPIGVKPSTVDLAIFALTVGFEFKVSVAAVLGAVAGVMLVSRR